MHGTKVPFDENTITAFYRISEARISRLTNRVRSRRTSARRRARRHNAMRRQATLYRLASRRAGNDDGSFSLWNRWSRPAKSSNADRPAPETLILTRRSR
jgi:hypothetical protein